MLKQYSEKIAEIKLFEETHKKIFEQYNKLIEEKDILEKELRAYVAEKGDQENDLVKAIRIERWKKQYNYPLFLENATVKEIKVLDEHNGIKQEIDKKVFEKLVDKGLISNKTAQKAFQEELSNIAVVIKNKIK